MCEIVFRFQGRGVRGAEGGDAGGKDMDFEGGGFGVAFLGVEDGCFDGGCGEGGGVVGTQSVGLDG